MTERKLKAEVLIAREGLIEMYKAGFLDAWKQTHKVKTKAEYKTLNAYYKEAFCDRFEKKVKEVFNEEESKA